MPRLETIGNIAIRVYAGDTQKHRRPHFHAVAPDANAVISLPDLDVIEGNLREVRWVLEWARREGNLSRLIEAWNRGSPGVPVKVGPR